MQWNVKQTFWLVMMLYDWSIGYIDVDVQVDNNIFMVIITRLVNILRLIYLVENISWESKWILS